MFEPHIRTIALGAVLALGPLSVLAGTLTEPPVFRSSNGVLDLLIIAKAKPVNSISFIPPNHKRAIHPVGWVYEICPRSDARQTCPTATAVAEYGGARLALQPGDVLKIRLVNRLPRLEEKKVKHSTEVGQNNLFRNPTNLHTHGLIVPARTPTASDPTFGDYVFVEIYNPANGKRRASTGHSHGVARMGYADYRIDIPKTHPSGLYWFHPHIHGLSLNQVSAGMAGIITIGEVHDYVEAPPESIRHLILKDLQVLAAGTLQYDGGRVTVVNGEVQHQQIAEFCEQIDRGGPTARLGYCEGGPPEHGSPNSFIGSTWYFTINGQVFPTIRLASPLGEIWRITNASGQFSYKLNLVDDVTNNPMPMQLVAVDGVSIDVPPATPLNAIGAIGGNKFTVAECGSEKGDTAAVCVRDLVMMPSSRAEVWVAYRDADGAVVPPPLAATATLKQETLILGPAAEGWPQFKLAKVEFAQQAPATTALRVMGESAAQLGRAGARIAPAVPVAEMAPAHAAPAADAAATVCAPLANGHRRRIFFGVEDPSNENSRFGLGYEEVDQDNQIVPGTQVPVMAFDPSRTTVCLPLGRNDTPVSEVWELVNLATESHNFHIHQTKFQVVRNAPAPMSGNEGQGPVILQDNIPVPFATTQSADIEDDQNGYCTIQQWRTGHCVSPPVVLNIPFSVTGEFVFHCHILEHEDGGMMARIRVVNGSM